MTSDSMIRELFRALESSLHERLGMIEDVIRLRLGDSAPTELTPSADVDRVRILEEQIATLTDRLAALEAAPPKMQQETNEVHVHRVGVKGEEIWIEPMRDLKIELPAVVTASVVPAAAVPDVVVAKPIAPVVPLNKIVEEPVEEVVEEEADEEVVEEEVVEEEVVEEEEEEGRGGEGGQHAPPEEEVVEEEVEEEEVEEEEVEEEEVEEAEGISVEVFEYKGKTYFRDGDNQVYGASKEDPDQPDENTIGTWDPARERILFRRAN